MEYNNLIEESNLSVEIITLECPKCHWIFKVKKPKEKTMDYSLVKPVESFDKIVVSIKHICRNPRCKHAFDLFRYELSSLP